ncbi:MAG TPA: hypothetical protein VMV34_06580 [Terriglobia bacterium]|nr:hypothetical protein [Terriglobia bacterium]
MQPTQTICESCQHSMLTKFEAVLQANKTERGIVIPIGVTRQTVAQSFCFFKGAGIALQFPILECEGYVPADGPKRLLKPSDFEALKEA